MHETWAAMESLAESGKVKNIGVCNVTTAGLRDILSYAKIQPAVLQIERHPFLQQPQLLRFCSDNDIFVVGFSPLGSGSYVELGGATESDTPLIHDVIVKLSQKYGKTPGQIVLKWGVQSGCGIIPKSSNPERLVANLDLFDNNFELSSEDMKEISTMDKHRRFNDPGVFTTFMNSFCPIFD
jgi:D-xylose reductase